MGSREVEAALAEHAQTQWGMFTAAQATRLGLSRKRLAWLTQAHRVAHTRVRGVYRFAGAPTDTRRNDLRATWLALRAEHFAVERRTALMSGQLDNEAIASHWSAALDVYDLGTDATVPTVRHFTVVRGRRTTSPHVRFHLNPATCVEVVDGLPVTPILQTVVDLFTVGSPAASLGAVLRTALLTARTDAPALTEALDLVTTDTGRDTLEHLLTAAGASEHLATASEQLAAARG
ncbi:type IV toxin-antitoxin system AbiEi family antitoxin domain-containing protein [Mycolicibacterium sp. Y3]